MSMPEINHYHPLKVNEAFIVKSGKYVGWPGDIGVSGWYYREDKLKEVNYGDIDFDQLTWSDFLEIAKKITKKGADGKTEVFGYGWTNRLWGSWMPWIFVNGGNLFTEDTYDNFSLRFEFKLPAGGKPKPPEPAPSPASSASANPVSKPADRPATKPTSAFSTCAEPPSPRNWRTASTTCSAPSR